MKHLIEQYLDLKLQLNQETELVYLKLRKLKQRSIYEKQQKISKLKKKRVYKIDGLSKQDRKIQKINKSETN